MGNATSYGPVSTEEGAPPRAAAGWCSCGGLNDMIYGVSPEEKQRREFFKNKAHILTKVHLYKTLSTAQLATLRYM